MKYFTDRCLRLPSQNGQYDVQRCKEIIRRNGTLFSNISIIIVITESLSTLGATKARKKG